MFNLFTFLTFKSVDITLLMFEFLSDPYLHIWYERCRLYNFYCNFNRILRENLGLMLCCIDFYR